MTDKKTEEKVDDKKPASQSFNSPQFHEETRRNPLRAETAPTLDEIKAWVRDWVRRELDLVARGVHEEGRTERNP